MVPQIICCQFFPLSNGGECNDGLAVKKKASYLQSMLTFPWDSLNGDSPGSPSKFETGEACGGGETLALRPQEKQDVVSKATRELGGSYAISGNEAKKRYVGFVELVFAIKTENLK